VSAPPHDLKAECALIAASISDHGADLDSLVATVKPEAFYSEAHSRAWKALSDIVAEGKVPDVIQLQARVRRNGDAGVVDAHVFDSFTPGRAEYSFGKTEEYARIVVDLARSRALLRALQESEAIGYAGKLSAEEFIRDTMGKLEAATKLDAAEYKPVFVDEVLKAEIESLRTTGNEDVPTAFSGIAELDAKLRIMPGELVIIAGRPGMGKSSLASQYAMATGNSLFCSLEMPNGQMARRAIAGPVGAPFLRAVREQARYGAAFVGAFDQVRKANVATVDKPGLTLSEVRAFARHTRRELEKRGKGALRAVVIDYLQLMTPETTRRNGTREEEVANITKALKTLAKQEKVAVILLSQLSREAEKTKDGRPNLAHLRESGAIEQDADTVMFVYRQAYYDKTEAKPGETEMAEVIVAKYRNGQPGVVSVGWRGDLTTFVDATSSSSDDGFDGY
jgi:replicative DNA helicase